MKNTEPFMVAYSECLEIPLTRPSELSAGISPMLCFTSRWVTNPSVKRIVHSILLPKSEVSAKMSLEGRLLNSQSDILSLPWT